MSIPTCKCCRRWKKVITNLLDGFDDDDENEDCRGGGGCTDADNNTGCYCNNTANVQRERKISIPIQLWLAIVPTRTNPHLGEITTVATTTTTALAQDFLSYEASAMNSMHLIYFPLLSSEDETTASSSTTTAAANTADSTISNFMQSVVEDLFIGNKEANFLVHDRSYFLNMLVKSIDHEGSTTPDICFRYARNTTYRLSGEEEEGRLHRTVGQSSSPCVVEFTLLHKSKECYSGGIIDPCENAYETFCKLLSTQGNSSSKAMVDLILKAHVMISIARPLTTQKTQSPSAPVPANDSSIRRKPSSDYDDGQNTKRRRLNTEVIWTNDVETIVNSSGEDKIYVAESEHDCVEEAISTGNNVTKSNARAASRGENCYTTNQSSNVVTAPVATEDGNSSESSSSSRGSSSSSDGESSSSDDDSEILPSQSSIIAQTIEEKSEVLITNLPVASGKKTPCVSAVDNNAVYTQESELVPAIRFEDLDDANRTVSATVQKNSKSDDKPSSSSTSDEDSSSSSSSSSVSEESDKDTSLKKGGSSLRSGGNDTVEQRSGGGDKANEKSTVPATPEEEDDGSTSSSSTGSSSTSDSSSDSDSDTSISSNEAKGETREA